MSNRKSSDKDLVSLYPEDGETRETAALRIERLARAGIKRLETAAQTQPVNIRDALRAQIKKNLPGFTDEQAEDLLDW